MRRAHLVVFLWHSSVCVAAASQQSYLTVRVRFTYQSQSTNLGEWLNLFTLCLTPLIAHIVLGISDPVLLKPTQPRWHDILPHFNPVSIMWRYLTIADRRFRSKKWDQKDMAACNAVFWNGNKWDGSEAMMIQSRDLATKLPASTHVRLFSASGLGTLVVILQAVQFIYSLTQLLVPKSTTRFSDGLPSIFFPLAFLGLVRILAAPWLSNEYGYTEIEQWRLSVNEMHLMLRPEVQQRLLDCRSGRGRRYRICWFLLILILWSVTLVTCTRGMLWNDLAKGSPWPGYFSLSNLLIRSFYMVLAFSFFLIHNAYLFTGRTATTVIPCIHAIWYKVYTLLLILFAVACIVVNALETCIEECGSPITYPKPLTFCDM
jgi:hypothetical protein